MFSLAIQLVNETARSFFLTGKAGTGKTTFLKHIREHCPKQLVILAPTGVAAINAGGVTLHSFFQLPLGPFIPESKGMGFSNLPFEFSTPQSLVSRLRFSAEKKKLLQELEILIIDEISMVRADLLDAVDTVLRHTRHKHNLPFGGVQVIFIGDLFQLPPVVKDNEWQLLKDFYNSPFFFDSRVLQQQQPLYIEFEKIYRQQDQQFIRVLNQVRNNELDPEGIAILEKRHQPVIRRSRDDGYIILCTHNEQARRINQEQLQNLNTPAFSYDAEIENDFPENALPADQQLILKEGAQVMFIRNDTTGNGKRYFNGKIGTVTRLDQDEVDVTCADLDEPITVKREKWENIRYSLDKKSQTLQEEVLGSFTQFPLRLAWAITIHKSQGLTFEKAIIDAGEAFAPGQVYVALSRCTSLEGLILKSRIRHDRLFTDPRIVDYIKNNNGVAELEAELASGKQQYRLDYLLSLFNYTAVVQTSRTLQQLCLSSTDKFNEAASGWTKQILDQLSAIEETAGKFRQWLLDLFERIKEPGAEALLSSKLSGACTHFSGTIKPLLQQLGEPDLQTDSRELAREVNDQLKEMHSTLSLKLHLLSAGNTDDWHSRRNSFLLPAYHINIHATAGNRVPETSHPELYRELKKYRDSVCARKDLPVYMVASGKTLDEMVQRLPQTTEDLELINGMGAAKIRQYGEEFLQRIRTYMDKHGLESNMQLVREDEPAPKKSRKKRSTEKTTVTKKDTFATSLQLFKEGIAPEEIARQRGLSLSTIEGHLSRYIGTGEIKLEELLTTEKIEKISKAIEQAGTKSLTPAKEILQSYASFSEIRWVMTARFASSDTGLPD